MQRRQHKINNGETPRKPDGDTEPKDKGRSSLELPEQEGQSGLPPASSVEPGVQGIVESASDKAPEKVSAASDVVVQPANPIMTTVPVSSDSPPQQLLIGAK